MILLLSQYLALTYFITCHQMIISFGTHTHACNKQKLRYDSHVKDEELEVMDRFMA